MQQADDYQNRFFRRETQKTFQAKVRGTIDHDTILAIGAEFLGQMVQKDTHLRSADKLRIREDTDHHEIHVLRRRWELRTESGRESATMETSISHDEAERLMRRYGVLAVIFKTRQVFHLGDGVVSVDHVEHLGDFVEVQAETPEALRSVMKALGLDNRPLITENYFDLMSGRALPQWMASLQRLHEHVGQVAFGITSGVLTTTGLLVGVEAATESRLAIIGSLVTIAVADASSDAYGMYMARMAQRGTSGREAVKTALGTWLGKFVLPFTFLLPVVLLPLQTAIGIDIIWACALLALLSTEQAFVRQESVPRAIARHIGLAVGVIVLSRLAGTAVHIFLRA